MIKAVIAGCVLLAGSATRVVAAAEAVYALDFNHTFASFEISHLGFSTTRGRFDAVDGTLRLDPANKTGAVEVRIDPRSISTGRPKFDDTLRGPEFFDVERHPDITFRSTEFAFDGERLTTVTGNLTMHGVTGLVQLDVISFKCGVHPLKRVEYCGADAVATIERSRWGISKSSPQVGENVRLEIQVEAARIQ